MDKVQMAVEPDELLVPTPDISHIETEDDTPVDNLYSEKQMRLLAESLYTSWAGPGDGRKFVAMANVGLFYGLHQPPLVPDLLVSLDVTFPEDIWVKSHRSYFVWEYGKAPDLVIEIVSNRKGGELRDKLLDYVRAGVGYYVVYDPDRQLGACAIRVFVRQAASFIEIDETWLEAIGLGLILWEGEYEGMRDTWLRWRDRSGALLASGEEAKLQAEQRANQSEQRADQSEQRADQAEQRANQAEQRANQAEQRANQAEQRAAALATRLRALGIEPDSQQE